MKDLIIKNGIIVTMEKNCRPFIGDMLIQDGEIIAIDRNIKEKAKKVVDASEHIVFPGLINGHIHGDSTMLRGIGDDLTLTEQNELYEPFNFFREKLSEEDRSSARQLTYLEALCSGTTFLLEFEYWALDEAVQVMKKTGIDGAIARNIYVDFQNPKKFIEDKELNKFIAECKKAGIVPMLSGPSEEYYDRDSMIRLYQYAKEKQVAVTQHFAETDFRMDSLMKKYQTTPAKFLIENKMLDKTPVIASHSVHVSEKEIEELSKHDFRVVNSAVSEQKISDGIAPIPEFLKAGIPVGLGTDGAEWNNGADMFREMKSLLLLHNVNSGIRSITTRQALELGTIEGAKALGLENEMGSLAPGKKANFILIDTRNKCHMQPLRTGKHENVMSTILYQVTGSDVTSVYVNGIERVQNGHPIGVNLKTLTNRVKVAGEHVLECFSEEQLGEIH